ncbi:MAG: RNA polymerase factor sigma-54 [Waddliaceae bacterium]
MYELRQTQGINQKQMQQMMMLPRMQQAISFLQAPLMEMSVLVNLEVQQNPMLEYLEMHDDSEEDDEVDEPLENLEEREVDFSDEDYTIMRLLDEEYDQLYLQSRSILAQRSEEEESKRSFYESLIVATPSIFEHLMTQAREAFNEDEMKIAEILIGNLDENGFLDISPEEAAVTTQASIAQIEKVLLGIQGFSPSGIAAQNLQESLLIQLKNLGQEGTLAYSIVEKYFDEVLLNHLPKIAKKLKCSLDELNDAISSNIATLDFHPGKWILSTDAATIIPDITIIEEGDDLKVRLHEDSVPSLSLNRKYLQMLKSGKINKETRDFLLKKVEAAKWMFKNIHQRNQTIYRITEVLTEKQRTFFLEAEGELVPLKMKTLAEELDLHESTIARAVMHKYADTPRGVLPLRSFFTNAYDTPVRGELSSDTVRHTLKEIIDNEDKKHPLSDECLSQELNQRGIPCARRTVAKYRNQYAIGNQRQRRRF